MVSVRTDIPTYVAEPPVVFDPVLAARIKDSNAPWTLSPEILARKNPAQSAPAEAGRVSGGHVVSTSVYTPRLNPSSPARIIKVNVKAKTNAGNPIEGLSFSATSVIAGKGVAPSGVVTGEVESTNALGASTFSIFEGVPINGVSGTTGWEITPYGRKWRNDFVPTSVIASPDGAITIILKPEEGTAQVKPGLF